MREVPHSLRTTKCLPARERVTIHQTHSMRLHSKRDTLDNTTTFPCALRSCLRCKTESDTRLCDAFTQAHRRQHGWWCRRPRRTRGALRCFDAGHVESGKQLAPVDTLEEKHDRVGQTVRWCQRANIIALQFRRKSIARELHSPCPLLLFRDREFGSRPSVPLLSTTEEPRQGASVLVHEHSHPAQAVRLVRREGDRTRSGDNVPDRTPPEGLRRVDMYRYAQLVRELARGTHGLQRPDLVLSVNEGYHPDGIGRSDDYRGSSLVDLPQRNAALFGALDHRGVFDWRAQDR